MGQVVTPGQFSFAGGEWSRNMSGRSDLQGWYNTVLRSFNFEVDPQGQLRFRGGFTYVVPTLNNKLAVLVPFVFSTIQSYMLELTDARLRVFMNRGLVSGGTLPLTTPWPEAVLYDVQYDGDTDVMVLTHPQYPPQQLTRTGHANWTIAPFNFIDGPYLPENPSAVTMTAAAATAPGNSTNITVSNVNAVNGGTGFVAGDVGRLLRIWNGSAWAWTRITALVSATVVTVQVQGTVSTVTAAQTRWQLGAFADSVGWPTGVAFYESRLVLLKDTTLYGSKAAKTSRDYNTYTPGTLADDPYVYTLPGGNSGRWLQKTQNFLAVGTFGGVRRAYGGSNDQALTPTTVNVRPISENGAASVKPVLADDNLIYLSRDLKTVFAVEYDALKEGYAGRNKTITAEHVTQSGVRQQCAQLGGKNKIWEVLRNGRYSGLTFLPDQQVYGWHSHNTPGTVVSMGGIPNVNGGEDELWAVVRRNLNGVLTHCVEWRGEQPVFPELEDFYTSQDAEESDRAAWLAALYETQKTALHLDCALTYNGQRPTTLNLSATTGEGVTATAGAATFVAGDVGRQITGAPLGRAVITGYTSSTQVTVDVLTPFPTTLQDASRWYLTTNRLTGATHLGGMTVRGVGDGQDLGSLVVDAGGGVDLPDYYGYVHLGLYYEGLIVGNLLEGGSQIGTSQGKPKNVRELVTRFYNTLGAWMGTRLYGLQRCEFPKRDLKGGWATPVFTGDHDLSTDDDWQKEKRWYIAQRAPLPCTVQQVVPRFQTIDG